MDTIPVTLVLYSRSPDSKEKHISSCRENGSLQIGQEVNKETWLEMISKGKVTFPQDLRVSLSFQTRWMDAWVKAGRKQDSCGERGLLRAQALPS